MYTKNGFELIFSADSPPGATFKHRGSLLPNSQLKAASIVPTTSLSSDTPMTSMEVIGTESLAYQASRCAGLAVMPNLYRRPSSEARTRSNAKLSFAPAITSEFGGNEMVTASSFHCGGTNVSPLYGMQSMRPAFQFAQNAAWSGNAGTPIFTHSSSGVVRD